MVNAQEWLDSQSSYNTKQKRERIRELNISNQNLEGPLVLNNFSNLKELDCSNNKLTFLDITNSNSSLEILKVNGNLLSQLDWIFHAPTNLKVLNLANNNWHNNRGIWKCDFSFPQLRLLDARNSGIKHWLLGNTSHVSQVYLSDINDINEWLGRNFPREQRMQVKELNISNKELGGDLDLSDFTNLETLDCSYTKITSLDVSTCKELTIIMARDNLITDIELPLNSERLKIVQLGNNNFPVADLSLFSRFNNLNDLRVGTDDRARIERNIYNRFSGSFETLKDLTKLKILGLSNTDIDSGLECLPESLETIYCYNLCRNEAGCKKILDGLNNIQAWRRSNPQLIITRWKKEVEQSKKEIMDQTQRIQKLEDELQMEREEVAKALEKAKEWRERQLKEITEQKDREIEQLQTKVSKLEQQLMKQNQQVEAYIQIPPKK